MELFNTKSYDEQRYERLLESIDEYICNGDDISMLIPDLVKALAELKKLPLTQVKKITQLQELLGAKPSLTFVIED